MEIKVNEILNNYTEEEKKLLMMGMAMAGLLGIECPNNDEEFKIWCDETLEKIKDELEKK